VEVIMTMAQAKQAMSASALTQLCLFSDVIEDEPYRSEIDGFAYAVFKVGDMIFVTADLCTHGPGSLSEGYVEDCQVECPFHQGKFDLRTGMPTQPPCEVPIRTWTPVVRDGAVFIDVGSPNGV
jgi:anthranilate 1,2-dioxygenase ferredoxin subunit